MAKGLIGLLNRHGQELNVYLHQLRLTIRTGLQPIEGHIIHRVRRSPQLLCTVRYTPTALGSKLLGRFSFSDTFTVLRNFSGAR